MKKALFLLMLPAVIALASCGGEKKDETAKIPGMMEVDLTSYGFPITIMIPDSTKGKAEIIAQSWGATEIKVGKNFQISIKEGTEDLSLIKSDNESNDVNKLKRYINDEPELLFWESEITEPEHHFMAIVKSGAASFVVEDIKGEIFKEEEVKRMIESAKSIKVKETPAS